MDVLASFMAYAADFERTYADDEWSRLVKHFAPDAVYEVAGEGIGCRLVGPEAILAGMRKSVDNFDRKFESRQLEPAGAPEVEGDSLRVDWRVLYDRAGWPQFVLRGRTEARVGAAGITLLRDSYAPEVAVELAEWSRRTGAKVNPSYV